MKLNDEDMFCGIRPASLWPRILPITLWVWALGSLALFFSGSFPAYAQERKVLFHEGFKNLDNWKPLYFAKIEKHTVYSIESKDDEHYLRAESNG